MYFSTYLPSNENVVSRQNLLEVDNPPFRVFLSRVLSQDFAPNDDIIDLLSGVGASTTKRETLSWRTSWKFAVNVRGRC